MVGMRPLSVNDSRPSGASFNLFEDLNEYNRDAWETANLAFGDTYPNQFNPSLEEDLQNERELERLSFEEWKTYMAKGLQRDEDDKPKIDRRPKRPAPPDQRQAVLGDDYDVTGN